MDDDEGDVKAVPPIGWPRAGASFLCWLGAHAEGAEREALQDVLRGCPRSESLAAVRRLTMRYPVELRARLLESLQ